MIAAARHAPHIDRMPDGPSTTKRCPICGKPASDQYRPFCGKRCADVDLNRWLSGVYAVPDKEDEEEDGKPPVRPADEAP